MVHAGTCFILKITKVSGPPIPDQMEAKIRVAASALPDLLLKRGRQVCIPFNLRPSRGTGASELRMYKRCVLAAPRPKGFPAYKRECRGAISQYRESKAEKVLERSKKGPSMYCLQGIAGMIVLEESSKGN
jgi:hypothetical protein